MVIALGEGSARKPPPFNCKQAAERWSNQIKSRALLMQIYDPCPHPPPQSIKANSEGILHCTNQGQWQWWRVGEGEGGVEKGEGMRLHCLVPSCINNTQHSAGKIPFVILFVLQANSLISPLGHLRARTHACEPLLPPHPLSVKVSIDHYLGLGSIHTNGLHYLLINTDGWR